MHEFYVEIIVKSDYSICLLGEYPTKHVVHRSLTIIPVSSVWHGYPVRLQESMHQSLLLLSALLSVTFQSCHFLHQFNFVFHSFSFSVFAWKYKQWKVQKSTNSFCSGAKGSFQKEFRTLLSEAVSNRSFLHCPEAENEILTDRNLSVNNSLVK